MFLTLIIQPGFDAVKEFQFETVKPKTKFSIIIPFRNEAENLQNLLESLRKLIYPTDLYEVLLVDDESSDDSVNMIRSFIAKEFPKEKHIRVVANNRQTVSPKKDAIITALSEANNSWIVTTDADCTFHENWLTAFRCLIF